MSQRMGSGQKESMQEKRPGYDVSAQQLCRELSEVLGTQAIERVRIFQRYDVEGVTDEAFDSAKGILFSEPNVDMLYDETLPPMDARLLAVEYLPGSMTSGGQRQPVPAAAQPGSGAAKGGLRQGVCAGGGRRDGRDDGRRGPPPDQSRRIPPRRPG